MIRKEKISTDFVLPLIAAASVLRKDKLLKLLLLLANEKKISWNKIYETLLQSYLFAGFPSALISLKIFNDLFPGKKKVNNDLSIKTLKIRGEKTCKKIYEDKYDKLISNVKTFSPELADWLLIEGYGKVLSRKQLSLKDRELSIISMLTVLKFEDQLYSHISGALRLGVKAKYIKSLINLFKIFGSISYTEFGTKVLQKIIA